MMNISTNDEDTIHSKVENNDDDADKNNERFSKALARSASSTSATTTSTSRQWSGFKNPRIVRVSRTFGGKDRHSKVCTIRGLRDRRIRLSVPTAIQLYELQDRLGVNQPSKVIDWLLDATKLDIDKLPPLQIPPGSFGQFYHQQQSLIGPFSNANAFATTHNFTTYFNANLALIKEGTSGNKEKININDDVEDDEDEDDDEIDQSIEAKLETIKWNNKRSTSEEDQGNRAGSSVQISPQTLFPMGGNSSFLPGLMNSSALPYNSLYNWDPANLSLSQFGSHGSLAPHQPQAHQHHQGNDSNYSSGGGTTSTQQLFFNQPAEGNTSIFLQQDNRFHPSNASLSPFQNNAGHPEKGHN